MAIFFGLLTYLWAQGDRVGDILRSGPTHGLAVAAIGVITALTSLFLPMFKMWMEERRYERDARIKREDLAGKLARAELEIRELSTGVTRLTRAEDERAMRETGPKSPADPINP